MYDSRMLPSRPLLAPAIILQCRHLLLENQTKKMLYLFSYTGGPHRKGRIKPGLHFAMLLQPNILTRSQFCSWQYDSNISTRATSRNLQLNRDHLLVMNMYHFVTSIHSFFRADPDVLALSHALIVC